MLVPQKAEIFGTLCITERSLSVVFLHMNLLDADLQMD